MRKKVYDKIKVKLGNIMQSYSLLIAMLILILGLIYIFWNEIVKSYIYWFPNSSFCTFFSKVPNNSIRVGIWILIMFVFVSIWLYNKNKYNLKITLSLFYRYIIEVILIIFTYDIYVNNSSQDNFYYVYCPKYTYVSEIWFFIILVELILIVCYLFRNKKHIKTITKKLFKDIRIICKLIKYFYKHNNVENKNNQTSPYIMDSPTTEDSFKRSDYAKVLLEKIFVTIEANNQKKSKKEDGSFVINISESYGYGKSSFLLLLKDQANVYTNKNQMVLFEYKPWLCDSPQKIISEFFKLLNENLSKFFPHIGKTINKYVRQLLDYYSSKNPIVYVISNCFKEQSSILKEREQLRKDIEQLNIPIVVLIDEVDRLHDDELMTLLSLLRNTADFTNVFYILAADIDYVKQVLKQKGITDSESYIKKFINFEFLIPGFDVDIMTDEYHKSLSKILDHWENNFKNDKDEDKANLHDLRQETERRINGIFHIDMVFRDIRDMKRFLNNYSMAIDCYIKNHHEEHDFVLDMADLFAVELLKYLYEPMYKILRDRDDSILDLKDAKESKDSARYFLKEDIKNSIIDLEKAEKTKKNGNKQTSLEELLSNRKTESADFIKCKLLNFLFPNNNEEDKTFLKLCYEDSYFRYFSYRLKNNQMSFNQVFNLIYKTDIDQYKQKIIDVIKNRKQNSFIHIIRTNLSKHWKFNVDIILKLFIFIDEGWMLHLFEDNEQNSTGYQKKEHFCEHYGLFDILENWLLDRHPGVNEEGHENCKTEMTQFVLNFTSQHYRFYDLLIMFLIRLYNYKGEKLIFDKQDLSYFLGLFSNKIFINGNPIFIPAKNSVKDLLKKSICHQSNVFIWLTSLFTSKEGIFSLDTYFIKSFWGNKNEVITFVSNINIIDESLPIDEEMNVKEMRNDLMSLLKMEDISNEKAEEHPFLGYVERVNKKYQHE